MEVILREDVKSLGRAGELVKVKPGYARNYLLPKGLAYEATEGNRKRIQAEGKARQTRLQAERVAAEADAAKLANVELSFARKVGEGEKLFGSITTQDIADALAAKGHAIDRRKIDLEHPIKALGTHVVAVRLGADVHADLRVIVVAE